MRIVIAVAFFVSLGNLQQAGCAEINLHIGNHIIRADIANTQQSRSAGLMNSPGLCANCGMLFIFPKPGKYNFWMKDTPLPLSIAFIDANGSILNIAEMEANTLQSHSSQDQTLYALEMNKGWFAEHGVKPLQYVYGLKQAPRGK